MCFTEKEQIAARCILRFFDRKHNWKAGGAYGWGCRASLRKLVCAHEKICVTGRNGSPEIKFRDLEESFVAAGACIVRIARQARRQGTPCIQSRPDPRRVSPSIEKSPKSCVFFGSFCVFERIGSWKLVWVDGISTRFFLENKCVSERFEA